MARDFNRTLQELHIHRRAAEEDGYSPVDDLDEMRTLAGISELGPSPLAPPAIGAMVASPRGQGGYPHNPLQPSPRPDLAVVSVVANDPDHSQIVRSARAWRQAITQDQAAQDAASVFQDPKVQQSLHQASRIAQDIRFLVQQTQARMEGLALQMAQLVDQAARGDPDTAARIREQLPHLPGLIRKLRSREYEDALIGAIDAATTEIEYKVSSPRRNPPYDPSAGFPL